MRSQRRSVHAMAAMLLAGTVLSASATNAENAPPAQPVPTLRPVADFAGIADPRERSRALFVEAGKVLQSPRCLNCHPVERSPTQGEDLHPHVPPVQAGAANHGVAGLPCNACHGAATVATLGRTIQSVPGHEHWSLAPVSMAWQKQSLAHICTQIKDRKRNGNRSLQQIHEHMANDSLVGWAWHPGAGRAPAPGTQAQFGELIQAWIESGAVCPAS